MTKRSSHELWRGVFFVDGGKEFLQGDLAKDIPININEKIAEICIKENLAKNECYQFEYTIKKVKTIDLSGWESKR